MKIKLINSKKRENNTKKLFLTFVFGLMVMCVSFAQSGKLSYQFDRDGDAAGWTTTNNSTSVVSGDVMTVTFDPALFIAPSTIRRADFKHTGGMTVNPTTYPIIAIKFNKPATANITFDTNNGSFKNGANKYTRITGTDIYYYDISTGTFGAGGLLLTAETALSIFQFKIADITSPETGYSVDWIASFASLADLQTLGINEVSIQKNELKIYPNPSTDKFFNIDLGTGYSTDKLEVKVYDLLGNLVLEKTMNANTTRINHNLGAGVYIVKVGSSATKLVVQ